MQKKMKQARFKLQRRLLTELPGLGKAGALERRPYPPGQHGGKRIKYSDFRLQLEEKQKIKYHYNVRDEQLLRLVKQAKKKKANWLNELLGILESRLQNFVFRAGFANSQMSAGQMISHGHVLVNGRKVNVRSYVLKPKDVVELNAKGLKNQIYLQAKTQSRLPLPDWITKQESETSAKAILADKPTVEAVPFSFDSSLVTSYYS